MLNRVFTSFLMFLWFAVANHCVVSAAFASPAKAAHHCGSKEAPSDPHNRCTTRVCCELFSPMTGDLDASPHLITVALPDLLVSAAGHEANRISVRWIALSPPAIGPPQTPPSLLRSLTLAQNAPPR